MNTRRKLLFENGREFEGYGFGALTDAVSDVVFCNSMVGHQEIVSDPSFYGKTVVLTYPLIGSCGLSDEDYESKTLSIGALIVREYNDIPSNFRYTKTIADEMRECSVPGLSGVDTRQITRMLRASGTMRAALVDSATPAAEAKGLLERLVTSENLVAKVSCKKMWYSRTANYRCNVVAVDCGIANSMIKSLNVRGCNVIVVPFDSSYEMVRSLRPDGVFFSGGPGDPEDAVEVVALARQLIGTLPVYGVGLGSLIIAVAGGAKVKRMKTGHHGQYPVMNLETKKAEITFQSHSHTVDEESLLGTGLQVTHRNLGDGSVEGIANRAKGLSAVQFHPENAPHVDDSAWLYDRFIRAMEDSMAERDQRNA